MSEFLSIWTVYRRPRDFPGSYVARRFEIRPGAPVPTADVVLGETLDHVRRQLPLGLVHLDRAPDDDPTIVEVWV